MSWGAADSGCRRDLSLATIDGVAYLTGPNNQLLFDGVFSYSYDPEGNRTARFIDVNANGLLDAGDTTVTTYAWDHRNRLTRVTDYDLYGDPATQAVDYLYDTENRWIGREVDLDADGQIDSQTRFIYDGNQIVLQFDRAAADVVGDPTDPLTIDHLSHRYLWNPAAVDQLMADEQVTDPAVAGDILWPLADHQGTIRDLAVYDSATDTTTVVNHRTFDAYGNLQSQTSTNPAHDTLFAFTGRPLDTLTSLQNNLNRWYDATTGRWMSEDPIGFEGKDGNLYAYVGNGPVNAVDPTGLQFPPHEQRYLDEVYFPNLEAQEWKRLIARYRHQLPSADQLKLAIMYHELAAGAYDLGEEDVCAGWTVIDVSELNNGYRAVLYHRKENGVDKYVLAFAGTDPTQIGDIIADIEQADRGKTGQYIAARGAASKWVGKYGIDNVHLVGHSLGGGMAASAALCTGAHATTFNPAGVHAISRVKWDKENWPKRHELITAYCVYGEILTTWQDRTGLPDTTGKKIILPMARYTSIVRHLNPTIREALQFAYRLVTENGSHHRVK